MDEKRFKQLWDKTGGGKYAGEGDSPYTQEFLDGWRGKDKKKKKKGVKQDVDETEVS